MEVDAETKTRSAGNKSPASKGQYLVAKTWAFPTGWRRPPISMNDRLHHHAKAKLTREIREYGEQCGYEIGELNKCRVELTWYVRDKRRRDEENPVATLKPFCDGLVDAGVVPDDTPEYMAKIMPKIVHDPTCESEIVFFITEIWRRKDLKHFGRKIEQNSDHALIELKHLLVDDLTRIEQLLKENTQTPHSTGLAASYMRMAAGQKRQEIAEVEQELGKRGIELED